MRRTNVLDRYALTDHNNNPGAYLSTHSTQFITAAEAAHVDGEPVCKPVAAFSTFRMAEVVHNTFNFQTLKNSCWDLMILH
ncbi:hypothetical protein TNCT_147211 [Trichonephila clavata]|uniref:Uncharacterized protein n=1 Tax=Trichonephila clavata TaxID=2740835 RepID=A0A8X6G317_TRICU|nr:hypothetical protein TNCT_147211 [Trichonephila clavata]